MVNYQKVLKARLSVGHASNQPLGFSDRLAFRSLALPLLLAILVIPAEASRLFFADQSLIGELRGPLSVSATDIDMDGDTDVLAASFGAALFLQPSLIWYVNDGNPRRPSFTPRSFNASGRPPDPVDSLAVADLDGDGDLDIIATLLVELGPGVVEWHENDGGSPPGFMTHLIGTNLGGRVIPVSADLDGDIDVAASSFHDDKIAWYENDAASPPSFAEHVITIDPDGPVGPLRGFADQPGSIFAADVNGDGRVDLLSASFDNWIAWYENDGGRSPSFTEHVITVDPDGPAGPLNGLADGPVALFVTDLDCDDHPDIVFASQLDNRVGWFDNYGSDHPRFKLRTISIDARFAVSAYAADVNGDGLLDVLSASQSDRKIAWYENLSNTSRCHAQEDQVP